MSTVLTLTKDIESKVTVITTTGKTQVTPTNGTYAKRLVSLICQCDDSTAQTMTVFYHDGTTEAKIGVVSIPINSGNANGTAPVDLLNVIANMVREKDIAGVSYFDIPINAYFSVQLTAITAGKTFNLVANSKLYN